MVQPSDIRARAMQYALRSIRLFRVVERKGTTGAIIGKQFLRSATSIGANIVEARSGESRADFIHKYSIAQKEANESLYWLTLLAESHTVSLPKLQPLIDETRELIAIITTIIVNTKKHHPR
jgi:four helix bundle protein